MAQHRWSRFLVVGVVLALMVGAAACSSDSDSDGSSSGDLSGEWQLTRGPSGVLVPQSASITAKFADGTLSGQAPCNSYSATYTVKGTTLTISKVAGTKKTCGTSVDAAERAYFAALGRVEAFSSSQGTLKLEDGDGNSILTYETVKPGTIQGAWSATSVLVGSGFSTLVQGSEITATFGPDGSLSGNAGCNGYNASYTTPAAATITISQPLSTMMACADQQVQTQETAYLQALPRAASYELKGSTLTLRAGDGTSLVEYQRADG